MMMNTLNRRRSNSMICLCGSHLDERPLKKRRVDSESNALTNSKSILTAVVDDGATKYNCHEFEESEKCFKQALCQSDARSYDDLVVGLARITTSVLQDSTTLIEYDEGMRACDSLLKITKESSSIIAGNSIVAASLLYNIGQTYVQRRLYKEAILCFQKSIDKFTTSATHGGKTSNNDLSLNIIITLLCLGYCHYRVGNDGENKSSSSASAAMFLYSRAHTLAKEMVNVDCSLNCHYNHILAKSFNCIGVLLFNEHPCDTIKTLEMFDHSLKLLKSSSRSDASSHGDCDTHQDMLSIATVMNNIGRVHYLRGEFNEAHQIYEECLRIRKTLIFCGSSSVDVAATEYNLGQTCYHELKFEEALLHYHEYLKIIVPIAGSLSMSKDVALVYKGIAQIYHDQCDLKSAIYYYTLTLKCQRTSSAPESSNNADVASTLNKLGNLCYELKDFPTSMMYYQEGLKAEKMILPANHPHIVITMTNIGHIHKQLGQYKQAMHAYEQVREMQRKAFGEDCLDIAETMSSIGLMQYHLKDYAASFESYQEALRIRRQHLEEGDDCNDYHPDIASTFNSIGLVLFRQDCFELARECFTQSLRIRSKILGRDHRDVAILWYNIATIHFETGEDELAIQMYKETLRIERKALGDDHPDVVLTLQHLGQVHQQLGRSEMSIQYFKEALDIEKQRSQKCEKSIGRILNLLGNVHLQLGQTSEMMDCYIEASQLFEKHQEWGETLVIAGYNFYGLSKTNPRCAPVA